MNRCIVILPASLELDFNRSPLKDERACCLFRRDTSFDALPQWCSMRDPSAGRNVSSLRRPFHPNWIFIHTFDPH
jgi:hypothetical protein